MPITTARLVRAPLPAPACTPARTGPAALRQPS